MNQILASPAQEQVIVTHGFALTFVVAAWIGMPLEAAGLIGLPVNSGSITTLRQEAPFHNRSVVTLNDTSHLA
jgi:probable phosphoglycerate mutase